MTTIAYKDGFVAYDSRESSREIGRIITDKHEKKKTVDGVTFFLVGASADHDLLMESYFDVGMRLPVGVEANALVVDKGIVYIYSHDGERGYRTRLNEKAPHAFGSGEDVALGAMHSGKTAKEAVEIAKLVDVYTGGKVKVYKVGE